MVCISPTANPTRAWATFNPTAVPTVQPSLSPTTDLAWTERLQLRVDPPASVEGTSRDFVATDHDAIWLPDAKLWAVLRPHYGSATKTFYINSRRRANVKLKVHLQDNTISVRAIANIDENEEIFWRYALA